MTVKEYNKEKILSAIGLTTEQAPLFNALAGSLRSSDANIARLERRFGSHKRAQVIQQVIKFVNDQRLTFPLSDAALSSVIAKIYGSCSTQLLEDFKKTL